MKPPNLLLANKTNGLNSLIKIQANLKQLKPIKFNDALMDLFKLRQNHYHIFGGLEYNIHL